MRKRKRIKGVTSQTIAKMTRLARELEAANGLRIEWYSRIYEGRRYFFFDAVPILDHHLGCFCGTAFGYSVAESLRNFYYDMGDLLSRDKRWTAEERSQHLFITGLSDYQPARFNADTSAFSRSGLHGRRVILPRAVPYNSRSKALAKISDKQ